MEKKNRSMRSFFFFLRIGYWCLFFEGIRVIIFSFVCEARDNGFEEIRELCEAFILSEGGIKASHTKEKIITLISSKKR